MDNTDKADELAKTLLDSYNEEFNKANLTKNVQGNDIDILSVKKYMLDSYRKIDNYFEEAVRSKHANDSAAEIRKRSELNYLDSEYATVIQYNDENSLSSVLAIAYLSAMQYYFKPIRELPTGRGFADFVFLPKPEYRNYYPALVVELKWNKSAKSALQQIKDRKYPASIEQYTGDILLVGINYDKKTKKHECVIEQYEK